MRSINDLRGRLDAIVRTAGGWYDIAEAENQLRVTVYTDNACHLLICDDEYWFNEQLNTLERHINK